MSDKKQKLKREVKLELTNEWDDRDEDGESNGALAAVIFGRNPSSGCPAAAWHSETRPRGRAGAGKQQPMRAKEVQQEGAAEAGGRARGGDASAPGKMRRGGKC